MAPRVLAVVLAVRSTRKLAMTVLATSACSGSGGPPPQTVFDPGGSGKVVSVESPAIEQRDPNLDVDVAPGRAWIGVTVLRRGVAFARPANWSIRDAGEDAGRPFLRYVSPRAYSFALYERLDSPSASWEDIERHYEADVVALGAKLIGQRIPTATPTNQGRAYTIERKVDGPRPLMSRSREILLRGPHRVVLVQIVVEGNGLDALDAEVLAILQRLEVR